MKAMIIKEFRQLRRDRRTLAMMIFLPVLLLVILGYAASFDVSHIPTVVSGPDARQVAAALPPPFQVTGTVPAAQAQTQLRDGHAAMAVVTGGPQLVVLPRRQPDLHRPGRQAGAGRAGRPSRPGLAAASGPGALQPGAEDLGHHDPRHRRGDPGVRRAR